jgi:thioredoxin reductase
MMRVENIIVGAGPYGLSIAAHFRRNGIEALVIGRPMESWRNHMPAGMILKSEPFASNLSDPQGQFTVERFFKSRGLPYRKVGDPLHAATFIDYADWFRENAAPEVEDVRLIALRQAEDGFALAFDDGRSVWAKRVILATGHKDYQRIPPQFKDVPAALVSHPVQHADLAALAGKDVIIIGAGQSALETAALLRERGASVRIVARRDKVEWNSDPNAHRSPLAQLRYPDAGLGAGWYSLAISELPTLFHRLPLATRDRIFRTGWGPSGAWWLKERVGDTPILTARAIKGAAERNGKLHLSVEHGGKTEVIETDHVIAATGYKVDLARHGFLDEGLRARIAAFDGSPRLKRSFESSVPGLYFVGLPSAQSFGPVMRFVFGTKHVAAILTRHLRPARGPRRSERASESGAARVASMR